MIDKDSFATFYFAANDRFKILVISTIGEIYRFEEISPRTLVEKTALLRPSVIHSLFLFKKWVNSQNENKLEKLKLLRWVFLRLRRKNNHLNSILPVTLVIPNPGIG